MNSSRIVTKRLKTTFKKYIIFFAMILVTLNGMIPASLPVQAVEGTGMEGLEKPIFSKDVDGKESKEIQKGTDYHYNVNVQLPENVTGYETMTISDELDQRLAVQKTAVLINEKLDETVKVVIDGQKISLALTREQLKGFAGNNMKLQITAQVKKDATNGNKIDNIAKIAINNNVVMETNPVVVTPIDLEEKDQAEPDELKEEKDQSGSTASKEDGEKNVESNEDPSTEKSTRASVAAASSFNINNTDSYASVLDNVAPRFRMFQLDGTSTVVKASVNLTFPPWVGGFNGVAVSKDNFIYTMASGTSGTTPVIRIFKINSAGNVVATFNPTLTTAATAAATMIGSKYYYIVGTTLYYYDVVTNQQGKVDLVNDAGAPLTGLGADLVADSDGYLWVSQKDNLLQVNPATGGIIRALPVPGLSTLLSPYGVRAMSFLADGRIMVTSQGYNTQNTRFTIDEDGKLTNIGNITGIPITSTGVGDLGSAVTPVFEPFPPILESDKAVKIVQKGSGNRVNQIPDQIQTGDTLAYTIRARNTKAAPSILKGLSITDTLPEGVEYVPGTLMIDNKPMSDSTGDDKGEFVKGTVTGNIGDIIDTNYHTLTFQVKVLPGYESSSIQNTATVDANNTDPQNPTAKFVVEPGNADITLEKTVDHDTAYVGDTLTYTVKASNSSTGGAWNGTIADNLPEGVEIVSGTTQLNGTALSDDDVWTDSQLSVQNVALKAGETATVTFQVKVLDSVVNETISNVATADDPSDSDDPIDSNEVKTSILYKDPVLESAKSAKLETKAEGNTDEKNPEVGDTIRYTITTKNTIEDSLVKNLAITDTIPKGLTYVAGSLEVDGQNVTDAEDKDAGHVVEGKVTGTFGDVTDTKEHTVTFLVTVDKGQAGADIKNIATVGGDNTGEPDEPEEEVEVYPRDPKFESEKTAVNLDQNKKKFEVGDTVVYTIKARNAVSESIIKNFKITDKLVDGLEYVEGSLKADPEVDATFENGTFTANFGEVKDTKWRTLTFHAKIKSGQSGKELKNIATVEGEGVPPTHPEVPIKVDPKDPKLESKKSSKLEEKADGNQDAEHPEVGDTIRYTITTKNTIEDSLVKNLAITDTIPKGLTYVAGSLEVDGQNVTDAEGDDAGHVVDGKVKGTFGDVTDTKEHTVTFLVTVDKGQAGADIKNIATVGGDNTDPDEPDEPEEEVKVYPRDPKFESEKTAVNLDQDKRKFEVGDTVVYTIKARNAVSESIIKNFTIKDKLIDGLEYVEGSLKADPEVDATFENGTFTANFGEVKDTKWRTLTFHAKIKSGQSGKELKNIATVEGEEVPPTHPEVPIKVDPKDPKLESKKSSKLEQKGEGNKDAEHPEVGDTIRYTITTKNTIEDSLVKNLAITDRIPKGLTYVAGSLEVDGQNVTDAEGDDAGHVVDGKVKGTFGDVTDTKEHTVTFLVTVDKGQAGADIKNIATVGGDNTDPDEPDEPEEEVKVYPRDPKFESEKTAVNLDQDKKKFEVGDTVVYTIKARNAVSESIIKNFTIKDKLIDGLEYVEGSLKADPEVDATFENGTFTANFGEVKDTEWRTLTFHAKIKSGQSGKELKNIATVEGEEVPPTHPEVPIKVDPKDPKLESKKSSKLEEKADGNKDAEHPEVGDTIRYTITTKNTIEDSLVKNLVITDTIPKGLTYVAGSLEVDGQNVTDAEGDDAGHVVDGKVKGTFGDVTDTKEHTVTFLVTVDKGQAGADIKNIATVGGDNTDEPDEPEEEVKVYPRNPKFESEKTAVNAEKGKEKFEVGDTIVYTIKARNKVSDSLVENMTISDALPEGLEYVSDSLKVSHEGKGEVKDGEITVTFGDVKDTEWRTVTFEVKIKSGQSGKEIENIATVDGDNVDEPDKPKEKVTVDPKASKLESNKSAVNVEKDKEKFEVGDTIVYTIKTRNTVSDSLVKNLSIADKLPEGLEYVSDSLKVSHEGKGEFKDGKITATFGDVKDTEWRTVTFQAKIKSGQSGKAIENVATVGGDNVDEPDKPEEKVTVDPKDPVLKSEKSAKLQEKAEGNKDKDHPEVGDTLLYTIKTQNTIADSLVKNLVISDDIPEGLEYVAGSLKVDGESVTDAKDNDKGHTVDGSIAGQFGDIKDTNWHTVEFLVTVKSGQAGKDIQNIAVVDGDNVGEPDKPEEEVQIYPRHSVFESEKSAENAEKGKEKYEVGDTIVYTIKSRNKVSDSLVESLTIADTLPEGLEYVDGSLKVSHEGKGEVKNGKMTATFGDVTDTEWRTVTFEAKIKSGQSGKEIENIATVGGDNVDEPDKPGEKVIVDPKNPKLESEKSAENAEKGKEKYEVGDTIVYTIKTRNTVSDSLVKNLSIADKLPEGLEYVSDSLKVSHEGKGEFKDGKMTAIFGDVTDTEWRTVTFQVKIKSGQSGKAIENIATVGGDNVDEPDKPKEKVTVDPKDPVLKSEKSAKLEAKAEGNKDKDHPEVGDTLLYTIKTQNTIEDSLVKNLVISDEIPEGLEYVAGSLKVDGKSVTDVKDNDKGHAVAGSVAGQFGDIKDTDWHTVEFMVTVKSGQAGKDIKNVAVVEGDNIDTPDKPEEVVQVYPRNSVLESEKLAVNLEKDKDSFTVGDMVVYTIKARNKESDSLVENLTIADKLPAGLEYVDGSLEVSHQGTGGFIDGIITATFGDVKDTEWRTVTFKAKIQSDQFGKTIKNIAEVSSKNVPVPNHPEAKIEVEPKDPTPTPEEPKDSAPTPDQDDDQGNKTPPSDKQKEDGNKLPNTATNLFNYGLIGIVAILAGLLALRRRKPNRD